MTSNTKNNKKELAAIEKRMEREIFGTVSTVRAYKHRIASQCVQCGGTLTLYVACGSLNVTWIP